MCKENGRRAVEITLTFDPTARTTKVEQRYLQCNSNRMLEPNTGVIKNFLGINFSGVVDTEKNSKQCIYDPGTQLDGSISPLLASLRASSRPVTGSLGAYLVAGGGVVMTHSPLTGPAAAPVMFAGGAVAAVGGVVLLGDAAYQFFTKESDLRFEFERHLKIEFQKFHTYSLTCAPSCVPQKVVANIFSQTTSNNVSFYDMAENQMNSILQDFHVLADISKCADRFDGNREVSDDKGINLNEHQRQVIERGGMARGDM